MPQPDSAPVSWHISLPPIGRQHPYWASRSCLRSCYCSPSSSASKGLWDRSERSSSRVLKIAVSTYCRIAGVRWHPNRQQIEDMRCGSSEGMCWWWLNAKACAHMDAAGPARRKRAEIRAAWVGHHTSRCRGGFGNGSAATGKAT